MGEILFSCAGNRRVVIATLSVIGDDVAMFEGSRDVLIAKSIESAADLHKGLRVKTYKTKESAFQGLEAVIYVFRSRMEALLFLISALLLRGLEIVSLLLCRQAVRNVFDGNMDLGGGMSLKGISKTVEVGFLTLLESLNFCKVGYHLKCPRWPNWVVGSESRDNVVHDE